MSEKEILEDTDLLPFFEEKGDLGHAIRCAEQAAERATSPWLKKACSFRAKMLRIQLAKQNQI